MAAIEFRPAPARTPVLILALGLLAGAPAMAENVYRWTDDNGEVHYTTTLPPEQANKPHQILNSSGMVVRDVRDPLAEQQPEVVEEKPDAREPLYTEEEKQVRSDRLLVLKYQSEEDILEAMEVEVANLDYDARLLEQSRASVVTSLTGQIREAADRQRAGMPLDPEIDQQVALLRNRLRSGRRASAALAAREERIRANFTAELERYRYLMEGGKEGVRTPES